MSAPKPTISRLLDLHRLLVGFQDVDRVVHVPSAKGFRQENDTEHSYNLALMAWFLADHFPALDRDKIIRYALAHDIVEIHAGDTYVYADQATLDSKAEREAAALAQLESDWPDFPALTETIQAYEQKVDEEARFVYALDKIMPVLLIFIGQGHTWREEGITLEMLHGIKRDKVKLSPEIDRYYQELYKLLEAHQHYFAAKKPSQQG